MSATTSGHKDSNMPITITKPVKVVSSPVPVLPAKRLSSVPEGMPTAVTHDSGQVLIRSNIAGQACSVDPAGNPLSHALSAEQYIVLNPDSAGFALRGNIEAYKDGISVDDIPDLRIFSAVGAENIFYEGLWFNHSGKLYTMPRMADSFPNLEDRMEIDDWKSALYSAGKISAVLPFEAKID